MTGSCCQHKTHQSMLKYYVRETCHNIININSKQKPRAARVSIQIRNSWIKICTNNRWIKSITNNLSNNDNLLRIQLHYVEWNLFGNLFMPNGQNYHPSELHKLLFPRKRSPNSSELFAWNSNFPTSFSITCWLASQNKVKLACDHSGISATQQKKKTDIKFLCLKLRKKTFMVIAHFQKFSKRLFA